MRTTINHPGFVFFSFFPFITAIELHSYTMSPAGGDCEPQTARSAQEEEESGSGIKIKMAASVFHAGAVFWCEAWTFPH